MRTRVDLFSFFVWSEYSVVENPLGGQPRNTPNTRDEDQGMRTREVQFSFSVWSEYSVVENPLGGQPPTISDRNYGKSARIFHGF
jgi:hypothetical protein